MNVSHVSAVPVGGDVWCETEVVDVDRRRVTFKVAVYSDKGLVGEGLHERFVIDVDRFASKL